MAGASPSQQAAPKEQAAAEQQATSPPQISAEQQAAADKLGLPAVITNSIGMKLVLIPAGEFLMGSPEGDVPEGMDRRYAKAVLKNAPRSTKYGSRSRFTSAFAR